MNNEFLCKAYKVMPTHPMAVHLGNIKDIQDYKQKIVKQAKLRNKTLKEVRKLFTAEDINMIEKHLTGNIQKKPENRFLPEETKFIPKIKSDQVLARPIFKSKFERYEWHLKNGCMDPEERYWFENYKKTKEYSQIYGG